MPVLKGRRCSCAWTHPLVTRYDLLVPFCGPGCRKYSMMRMSFIALMQSVVHLPLLKLVYFYQDNGAWLGMILPQGR